LAPGLAITFSLMALLYAPRPHTGLTQLPPVWRLPAELITQPIPLKPDEVDWLTRDGAESAERLRFEWRGLSGSMITITSQTWRAHHRPERCFEVFGLTLENSRTHLVRPDFPLRFVALGDGQQQEVLSSVYWFQSAHTTTDDYAARLWADLAPERDRWVLVSILFDEVVDPGAAEVQSLTLTMHAAVAGYLAEGRSP
jgi:exosortase O